MLFSRNENANTELGESVVNSRMVDLELDDGLAVITIDRPHARNAISLDTMDALDEALTGAEGARALVIKGAGDKAFVSGGDLKELSAIRTEADAAAMAWRMRKVCDRIAGFPGPVLAALNGHALGGGAEVAVAADIRLAADDVKIGFNQVTLEIMPAWAAPSDSRRWWARVPRYSSRARGPCSTRRRPNGPACSTASFRGLRSRMNGEPLQENSPTPRQVRSSASLQARRPTKRSRRSPGCGWPMRIGRQPTR